MTGLYGVGSKDLDEATRYIGLITYSLRYLSTYLPSQVYDQMVTKEDPSYINAMYDILLANGPPTTVKLGHKSPECMSSTLSIGLRLIS